jgi:hypothetical protein
MSVTDQTKDHQARCLAHLIKLRMLANGEAGTPPPRWVAVEVAQATEAVIAEAEAAGRAVLAAAEASGRRTAAATFLRVRLDRLAAAANEAISAARAGNSGDLRRHLHRFDALTAAIWTVHGAVYAPRPPEPTDSRQVPVP